MQIIKKRAKNGQKLKFQKMLDFILPLCYNINVADIA